jgi:hypothetical protein
MPPPEFAMLIKKPEKAKSDAKVFAILAYRMRLNKLGKLAPFSSSPGPRMVIKTPF